MAVRASSVVARPLRALLRGGVTGGLSDGQLLDRFAAGPREAAEVAFESLIERHGPMVLRVCQRVLDLNDAEDAFQATFLVLLRHASSIRDRGSVASWLYGVAMRIAARAKVEAARRRRIEARGIQPSVAWDADAERQDLETLIHEELTRLPEKYRAPIVLCYLEGLTHEGAADQLGWPVGTVRGRLSRARDVLRARLTRRGVTASAALAAVGSLPGTSRAAVSAALRDAAVRSAVEVISGRAVVAVASAQVAAWVEGASPVVVLYRLKTVAGLLLLIGTLGIGLGLVMGGASPSPQQQVPKVELTPPPSAREADLREMLQLKGTWSRPMTRNAVVNGVPQPPKTDKLIWSIDRNLITDSGEDGFADHTYRITIEPNRTPKSIDLTVLNTGITLLGIYKLDGDALTVCYGIANGNRPGEFRGGPTQFQTVFHRESRTPLTLPQQTANAPGCYWSVKPFDVSKPGMMGDRFGFTGDGMQAIVRKDPQGGTLIALAYMTKYDARHRPMAEYRPVIFDEKGARHVPRRIHGSPIESSSISGVLLGMFEYHLDLPRDGIQKFGIEVFPAEVLRTAEEDASAKAFQEAREAGIELLPRPKVGKPFEFSLTAADGRVLRSHTLEGQVVLIVCWASQYESNRDEMPRLKNLYERRHGEGFEVIGLNFDRERASGERSVKALALPWPQVFVPADPRTWNLWSQTSGFPRFPGLILIDRQGILRWDGGNPEELDKRINALLDVPRPGK